MHRRLISILLLVLVVAAVPASAGTIYLNIFNDPNPGNVTLSVRSVSSTTPVFSTVLAPNQGTGDKVLTVPSGNYVVSFSWGSNFHNLANGGGHPNIIATCNPPTGACSLQSWQAAGTGVNASIPVKVP